jgi:peroxiredoxin
MKHRSMSHLAVAVACAASPFPVSAVAPTPSAESLLDRAVETYRALQTYEDEWKVSYDMVLEDKDAQEMFGPSDMETTLKLAFTRPNRLALETDQVEVYCDGVHLWTVMPVYGQFTEERAPDTIDAGTIGPPFCGGGPTGTSPHPILALLVSPQGSFMKALPEIESLGEVVEAEWQGRPGHRVTAQMQMPGMMSDIPGELSIWVDGQTGLIREFRFDMTAAANAMADEMRQMQGEEEDEDAGWMDAMPRYEKLVIVMAAESVVCNAEIPPKRFAFGNEAEYEEVEEFSWGAMGASDQQELVGEPAPEFTAKDIDGAELSLSELKGRVVVLDFWATWCGPCVQAIPHVQTLAERFADEPVTVLGINRDTPGSEQRVARFLEKKEVTFRQVLDGEGKIAEAYRVTGIPCTVLIDREGIIQDIRIGFMPGQEGDIAEDINRLRAGESLFDPDDVARRRERRDDRAERDDAPTTVVGLDPVAPDRLADAGRLPGQFNGYQARAIDVDGDGRDELVMPGLQGGAVVVAADGSSTRRVRFRGLPAYGGMTSAEIVDVGGRLHWLVIAQQYAYRGDQRSVVGLFDADGEPLWKYRPDLPEGVSSMLTVSPGDLDADGTVEFVVGLTTYNMQSSGRDAWTQTSQRAYLAVLGGGGEVLSLRRAGQYIQAVWVADAPDSSGLRTILCVADGRIRRYHFTDAVIEEATDSER